MASAQEHAVIASQLLDNLAEFDEGMKRMTEDQHLQAVASGAMERINRDMDWTVRLAQAHALTALALERTLGEN